MYITRIHFCAKFNFMVFVLDVQIKYVSFLATERRTTPENCSTKGNPVLSSVLLEYTGRL